MFLDRVPDWLWLVIANVSVASFFWLVLGRDRRGRGVIIPNEELIHEIKPYEAGALLAQGATYGAFLSLILDLERRQIVRLERTDVNNYVFFKVERQKSSLPMDEVEQKVLKRLMRYVFSEPGDEEAGSATLAKWSSECQLAFRLFETLVNKRLVKRGWFTFNPLHLYVLSGTFLFAWTYGLFALLESRGTDPQHLWIFVQIALIAPILYFMPRLSKEGALARERVRGLARYIQVAEKDRLGFHDAPKWVGEKKHELLPYSVALDINKEWRSFYLSGFTIIKEHEYRNK